MEKSNHHIIYSAEDIKRYLDGEMAPPEMNTMEKAALDDPFLAEAMEGYEATKEKGWETHLPSLRERFNKYNTGNKVIAISKSLSNLKKYAAAVLILGAAAITYLLVNNTIKRQQPQQTAQNNTPAAISEKNTVLSDSISGNTVSNDIGSSGKREEQSVKPIIAQENNGTISKTETKYKANADKTSDKQFAVTEKYDENISSKAARTERSKTKLDSTVVFANARSASVSGETVANNAARQKNAQPKGPILSQQNAMANSTSSDIVMAKKQDRNEEANRTFIAQVVGPDNNPLPFANINVTNQGFGTYADVKGNVRLVSTDSIIPIEVKSLGYATQNAILRSNNQLNRIVLKEAAMAISDRIDYNKTNTQGRRNILLKYNPTQDSSANAEPADGWDNYNTYVLNNTELPEEVLNKNLHGEVEVSFDVKRNGTITNVKVDKSLCNDCDEIAKRLVEQGPQWKVKKGRKAKGKVKVQF